MITDKERHERAKNFRDMISAREYGIPGKVGSFVDTDDLISELLDRRVYDSEVAIDACEALCIADLIDQPTCRNNGNRDDRGFWCSRCGYEAWTYDDSGCDPSDFSFCPDCGASVVDED